MSNFLPTQDLEPKPIDDDARKFVVIQIDPELIASNGIVGYSMDVYWTDTAVDTEAKVVRKVYKDDSKEDDILYIRKRKAADGSRKSVKTPITAGEFEATPLEYPGMPSLEKERTELTVIQDDADYVLKYDELDEGKFFMFEAEPPKWIGEADKDAYLANFDPSRFFEVIEEVSGNPDYEGFRIVETLAKRSQSRMSSEDSAS